MFQNDYNNPIRLLNADFTRTGYLPLPQALTSAITENYPEVSRQVYTARRESLLNKSLPSVNVPANSILR